MKYVLALLAGILLALVGAPGIAAATDEPTPAYHLLIWEVPGGPSSIWEPDQILADHLLTDTASLDLLDQSPNLKCGAYYQIDLEHNSATTDALVAGGVLHNPNDPAEDHAYGALGDNVNPWKYLTAPDCIQPPDEVTPGSEDVKNCETTTVVTHHWHDTVTYTGDVHGWTAQPAVRTVDADTTRAATTGECPPRLPLTGLDPKQTLALGLMGPGALLAGTGLLMTRKRRAAHRA